MKNILLRLLVAVFIMVLILVAFWVTRPGFFSPHHSLNAAPKAFDPHLSVLITQQQKQKLSSTVSPEPHASAGVPAPLDRPSEDELRHFPGAIVVEAAEVEGPEADQKIRLRILKTNFKYPFIRTEELIDQQGVLSRAEMVADHFLVTLPLGTTPEAFLKKLGLQATLITRVTSDASLYRVDLTSSSLNALPRGLEKGSEVPGALCEPDLMNHTQDIPNDPYFLTKQWGLQGACSVFDPFRQVMQSYVGAQAEEAWDIRTSAASVIVAVLDSGIRATHEDLAENLWSNPAPTMGDLHGIHLGIDRSTNAIGQVSYQIIEDGDVEDHYGHGTHCSGIIGAVGNNGVGVAGVAWKVQLMACKCQDDNGAGTVGEEIICMDYARNHGAMLFNCSIGATMPSDAEYSAIIRAREAGIIVVASVGNEGADNNEGAHRSYPASYPLDNIVAVAASTGVGELASFSNYGAKSVHLAAPGENIFSTGAAADNSYMIADGTSIAACFVTGTLALLKEQFPNESHQSLIRRVLAATDKYPELADKTISGGALNIGRALTDPYPAGAEK